MFTKETAAKVLEQALSSGGDFAEIFAEDTRHASISLGAGKVDGSVSARIYGAGVRIFKNNFYSYAYTSDLSEESLLKTAAKAAQTLREKSLFQCVNFVDYPFENRHQIEINPIDAEREQKVALLRQASQVIYSGGCQIVRTDVSFSAVDQQVLICNSDGFWGSDKRIRSSVRMSAIAEDSGRRYSGFESLAGLRGFEMFTAENIEKKAEQLAANSLEMLKAENCPAGRMPVVICPGQGSVLFHEACGHSLEATAVAKKASVFADKLGEMIANEQVTLIDDGTLPNHWGSTNIDDEGIQTRRNVLIEKGVLKGYLIDRFNARKMQMKPTGSSRRESFRYAPTSRMNNTFILEGGYDPEEIIADTPNGIYVAQISGGSVEPQTGEFNFSVDRAYKIENGKLGVPVKGAKLIGTGAEILQKVDRVGTNLEIKGGGMCGSLSGGVPVCNGQPTIRISSLLVGGQK